MTEPYSVGSLVSQDGNNMMWLALGVVGLFGLLAGTIGYLAAKRAQARVLARRSAADGEGWPHGLDA